MHIDENKRFDKRNLERNVKSGVIAQKDYEIYLSKLPDTGDKLFNPEMEEEVTGSRDEMELKRRGMKKKTKGK